MHDLNDLRIINPNENYLAHKEAFVPSRIRDVIMFHTHLALTFIRIEYDYFRLTISLKSSRKRNLYACVCTVNSPGYVLPRVSIKLSSKPAMMAPPTGTIKFLSKL